MEKQKSAEVWINVNRKSPSFRLRVLLRMRQFLNNGAILSDGPTACRIAQQLKSALNAEFRILVVANAIQIETCVPEEEYIWICLTEEERIA